MKLLRKVHLFPIAAVIAALWPGSARTAEFSFDRPSAGISFSNIGIEIPRAAPAPVGAHVYDFNTLYKSLGYPSPTYFGSTTDELTDLNAYTDQEDPLYGEINGYLRFYPKPYEWYGTGPDQAKTIVRHIDNIFKRTPALPSDLILFRGLGLGYRGNKPFEMGEEFTDKGYVSSSVSYKVAYHFAVEMGAAEDKPSRRAIFVVYLSRPGEKGILIDAGEDEVILGHGRTFRVMAGKDVSQKYDLYLVQACSGPCEAAVKPDVKDFWDGFSVPKD